MDAPVLDLIGPVPDEQHHLVEQAKFMSWGLTSSAQVLLSAFSCLARLFMRAFTRNLTTTTTTTIGLLNVMGTGGVCSHRGRGHHQLHKIHSIQSALECFSKQYDVFTSLVH